MKGAGAMCMGWHCKQWVAEFACQESAGHKLWGLGHYMAEVGLLGLCGRAGVVGLRIASHCMGTGCEASVGCFARVGVTRWRLGWYRPPTKTGFRDPRSWCSCTTRSWNPNLSLS